MNPRLRSNHDDLIRRAQEALDGSVFDEAEALGRRALMLEAQSLDARQIIASALLEQNRFEEATAFLQEILAQEPTDLAALADLGLCLFERCEFAAAENALARAMEIDPQDPQASYWMALCVERRGQFDLAEEYFRQAHEADPEAYPLPTRVSRGDFEKAMREALRELPAEIRAALKNLAIFIEDLPREETLTEYQPPLDPCLFGLYMGVPLPERSGADPPRLPDTICLFQRNLERMCPDLDTLIEEIRITVLHEVGHYLGFDEDDLEERGLA